MKLIAERMSRFEPTASSVATARARALAATGRDVIRLSQGEPDFPTPDNVKQAVIRAMQRDETKYTPTGGTAEMKSAIIHKFKRDNKLDYGPDQVMAGNGGTLAAGPGTCWGAATGASPNRPMRWVAA